MTKHNKDTDKLKYPDIRKILITNKKLYMKKKTIKTAYKFSKQ